MKILLATEGSKFSNAAIEKACRMFDEAEDTEIRVLTVIQPNLIPPQMPDSFPDIEKEVENVIRSAAERMTAEAEEKILNRIPSIAAGLSSKVAIGVPAQAIVDEAKAYGADLIVVGSHGYGFWERSFLGSVSNAVVHHAPCSVLVVRPDAKNAALN